MVKFCGQGQQQQQPQQNQHPVQQQNAFINDDTYNQQYGKEYADKEAWLDEHPHFTRDYFIRYFTELTIIESNPKMVT